MRPIPKEMRDEMNNNLYYHFCARKRIFDDHICKGRITWEHAWIYSGRQINEKWAIVPLCEYAHFNILDKEKNQYISIMRTSDQDFIKYPKVDWKQLKQYLFGKYKNYQEPKIQRLF